MHASICIRASPLRETVVPLDAIHGTIVRSLYAGYFNINLRTERYGIMAFPEFPRNGIFYELRVKRER